MTLDAAVHHDGSTPRKTNRSSIMMPSSTRQPPPMNCKALANISTPYINHPTRQSHETPRHKSIVLPQTIIQRPINIIAPEERNNDAAIDDKDCFVMHRKLLRRRHVRKVQKEQMIRRQRDAETRTSRAADVTPADIPIVIRQSNAFSDLTGSFDGGSCRIGNSKSRSGGATTTGQTFNRTISNNGALLEHSNKNNNQKNAGSAFKSTPLLYSPLRSTKRRRLFVSASAC